MILIFSFFSYFFRVRKSCEEKKSYCQVMQERICQTKFIMTDRLKLISERDDVYDGGWGEMVDASELSANRQRTRDS